MLEWIRHQIDGLLGLGPGAMVVALGIVILAIPSAIIVVFLMQRARLSQP